MLQNIHEEIIFRNITGGKVNLELNGKNELLKSQAEQASILFEERRMEITSQKIEDDVLENEIYFKGIVASGIPDGPKTGEIIELNEKSIFKSKDNQIILIEDIS